ncbi:Uncharacterised protein [Enterobacter hormaechei]|nr:hypothetical protein BvCmsHHP001_03550 [Escherichia coli]VAG72777.1 Uncharacterised protein [Enterobacter hormaechei]
MTDMSDKRGSYSSLFRVSRTFRFPLKSALANSTNLSDCCGIFAVSKTQEDYDTWCHFLYDSHVITSGVPLWIITSL